MKRVGWLLLLASQIVVIVAFWFWNHLHHALGNQLTGEAAGQYLAWGRLAGLLLTLGLLLQVVLIGRQRWVEQAFGLDRLIRLHHTLGFALVLLLAAHPVLLTVGHAMRADASLAGQFVDFCRGWEDVLAAVVGLAIIVAVIGFSVAAVRRRLRYEVWYGIHLALYIAAALTFGHQLAVGSDFAGRRGLAVYWCVLYALAFGSLVLCRIVRPLRLYWRHRFVVARLVPEAGGVTSVHIAGRDLHALEVEAGQFVIVRFLAKGFRWEAHPFSISQRPDGTHLRLTIKALGDFTRRIPRLPPGTPVLVDGPHGLFTGRSCSCPKVLMIAGGIGITPIRGVLDDLLAAGRDVTLVYANRNRNAVVFEQELAATAAAAPERLRVIHVMSDDPTWPGERGRIDRERLTRLVPDLGDREVYLCGPPPMMAALRSLLRAASVADPRVHHEQFAL